MLRLAVLLLVAPALYFALGYGAAVLVVALHGPNVRHRRGGGQSA